MPSTPSIPDPDSPLSGLFARPQPRFTSVAVLLSGLAVMAVIAVLGLLTETAGQPLLMSGFAASCVLVFVLPSAPVSQPMNVMGSHLVVTAVAIIAESYLPSSWWAIGLVTGVGVMLMTWLRVLHPPAAVLPIVVMTAHEGWEFLLTPVMLGALVITVASVAYRWVLGRRIRWFQP